MKYCRRKENVVIDLAHQSQCTCTWKYKKKSTKTQPFFCQFIFNISEIFINKFKKTNISIILCFMLPNSLSERGGVLIFPSHFNKNDNLLNVI